MTWKTRKNTGDRGHSTVAVENFFRAVQYSENKSGHERTEVFAGKQRKPRC